MNFQTLDQALSYVPSERISLLMSSGHWCITHLRDAAQVLVKQAMFGQVSCIALCGLLPEELIKAIIAFDGKVNAILLLPASLDESTKNHLIDAAGCTHRLDTLSEKIVPIASSISPEKKDEKMTRWLLATSGTTGTPKLIEHSIATLCRTVKRNPWRGEEYIWGLLYDPCRFAGIQVVLQALLSGSALCVTSATDFNAQIDGLLKNRVNALSATPSLWRKLLMDGRIGGLSLRQITLGGEIADQSILDGLRCRFPMARIVHIYASTEAGSAFVVQDGLAGFSAAWLDNMSAPVALKLREDGHLLVKPEIFPGGKEVLDRVDAEGYLDTQDLAKIEGDRVVFQGRASGAINVGGNKVNPEEIENYIREIDGVFDVRVFGKKSSMMGEIVAAEIICLQGVNPEDLRKKIRHHCRAVMESWQVPGLISFVKELKENSAGKRERLLS